MYSWRRSCFGWGILVQTVSCKHKATTYTCTTTKNSKTRVDRFLGSPEQAVNKFRGSKQRTRLPPALAIQRKKASEAEIPASPLHSSAGMHMLIPRPQAISKTSLSAAGCSLYSVAYLLHPHRLFCTPCHCPVNQFEDGQRARIHACQSQSVSDRFKKSALPGH